MYRYAGQAVEGAFFFDHWHRMASDEGTRDFVEEYEIKRQYGTIQSVLGLNTTQTMAVIERIEKLDARLARALKKHADELHYDHLLAMLRDTGVQGEDVN